MKRKAVFLCLPFTDVKARGLAVLIVDVRKNFLKPLSKDHDQLMTGLITASQTTFLRPQSLKPIPGVIRAGIAAQKDAESKMEVIFQKTQFWQRHKNTALSQRQIMALNKIFKAGKEGFPNGISAQKYAALAKCAKATATRDLGDLVSKDCLSVEGIGRGIRYSIQLGTPQRNT